MLRVAVRLPSHIVDVGEYLADVTALEAAGADAIWMDDSALDPWVILGAMAAVTHRVGLGCLLSVMDRRPTSRLGPAVAALHTVSRGRIVVGLPNAALRNHFATLRAAGARIFTTGSRADSTDGVILDVQVPEQLSGSPGTDLEVWAAIGIPPDREGWTTTLGAYAAAGATGVIVAWDPRLIDLLRGAGEPDDRTDLLIATG